MERKLTENIDELLKNKSFQELDAQDRLLVSQHIGGETEYEHLRAIVLAASREKEIVVAKDIKESLVNKMKAQHRPAWLSLLSYQIPAYATIITILLFAFAFYFLGPKREVQVIKTITKTSDPIIDTVLLSSVPDTVFIERRIEIKVPVYLTVNEENKPEVQEEKEIVRSGKSLADQVELRSILERSK